MGWTKEPEPEDPQMKVGVSTPADTDNLREMARTFTDEFTRLGYDEERLMHLFRTPFYVGPHGAYRALGEAEIRKIVADRAGVWGRVRVSTVDPKPAETLLTIQPFSRKEG